MRELVDRLFVLGEDNLIGNGVHYQELGANHWDEHHWAGRGIDYSPGVRHRSEPGVTGSAGPLDSPPGGQLVMPPADATLRRCQRAALRIKTLTPKV